MAPPSKEPPFLKVIAVSNWSGNRRYQVYALPGELVFVYAGSAGDVERAVGAGFGAVGGLIAAAMMSKMEKSQEERLEGLDFQQLVTAHEHNFRAASVHLSNCRIDPSAILNYTALRPHALNPASRSARSYSCG